MRNQRSVLDEPTLLMPTLHQTDNLRRIRRGVVDLSITAFCLLTLSLYCLAWVKAVFWMTSW